MTEPKSPCQRPASANRRFFLFLSFVLSIVLVLRGTAAAHASRVALEQEVTESAQSRDSSRSADYRDISQHLSAKARKEVFERIWREIRDHYYDPSLNGVDWNEVRRRYSPLVEGTTTDPDFYALMSQMTSELHDAHTRFSSPEQWKNYKKQQGVTVGFIGPMLRAARPIDELGITQAPQGRHDHLGPRNSPSDADQAAADSIDCV